MRPFRFRADGVLEIRRRFRDTAQARLAREEHALRAAARAVEQAASAIDEAEQAYRTALATGHDVTEFGRHRNWIDQLRRRLERVREGLEVQTRAVASAREALRLADRDVRVLERLRERALAKYQLNVRRDEMKQLDEFAALQFGRRLVEQERMS